MKKSEVFDYLVIKELMKEKAFSNVERKKIENKIEKLMDTKGTYENKLLELYVNLYEEEDEVIRKDLRQRILKLVPNDYDIKSDIIFYSVSSPVVKIRELEELEKECYSKLKEHYDDLNEIDDFFYYIDGREYIRLIDKIGCLYLDINKKDEYVKTMEKLLSLNPGDNLSVLDNLSLVYFNRKEYAKIKTLYSKHNKNLILQSLDYVIKVQESKDVKNEIKALIKRNHYLVYYFANFLDFRQKALDKLPDINYFPFGSLEETMLALLDIEETLEDEALEIYMRAFLSYKGDEIVDYLSEDELTAMYLIVNEADRDNKDPTKERIYKAFDDQKKRAILEERKYIPNNDKEYLEKMLNGMVEKHLIEINGVRVTLTLGGIMHMYTITKHNEGSTEEEVIEKKERLIS